MKGMNWLKGGMAFYANCIIYFEMSEGKFKKVPTAG
jgi:hypothetical protein